MPSRPRLTTPREHESLVQRIFRPLKRGALTYAYECTVEGCDVVYQTVGWQHSKFLKHLSAAHPELFPAPTESPSPRQSTLTEHGIVSASPLLCSVLARFGIAFRIVDDDDFCALLNFTPPGRNFMPLAMSDEAERCLRDIIVPHFNTPTMALDVGTVRKRYLTMCLVEGGNTAIVDSVCDSAFPDKKMSIPNVRAAVSQTLRKLNTLGVFPIAVVADNAANMQGIANEVSDVEEVSSEDDAAAIAIDAESAATSTDINSNQMLFVLRCAAHVLQLIATDRQDQWGAAFDIAMTLRDSSVPSPNATRWSTKFVVIDAVLRQSGIPAESLLTLTTARDLLKPIWEATNFIQEDSATLFDALCMVEATLQQYAGLESDSDYSIMMKSKIASMRETCHRRLRWLLSSPLYMVIVYFLPCVNRAILPAHIEDIVKSALVKVNPDVEWQDFIANPAPKKVGTTATFAEAEMGVRTWLANFPTLKATVMKIIGIAPTEASVERAFSAMKSIARPLRNRLRPEVVRSSMIVASANRLSPDIDRRQHSSQSPSGYRPTTIGQAAIELVLSSFSEPQRNAQPEPYLRSRDPSRKCDICSKKLEDHENKPYVACTAKQGCRGRAVSNYQCAGFPIHRVEDAQRLSVVVLTNLKWTCEKCSAPPS